MAFLFVVPSDSCVLCCCVCSLALFSCNLFPQWHLQIPLRSLNHFVGCPFCVALQLLELGCYMLAFDEGGTPSSSNKRNLLDNQPKTIVSTVRVTALTLVQDINIAAKCRYQVIVLSSIANNALLRWRKVIQIVYWYRRHCHARTRR